MTGARIMIVDDHPVVREGYRRLIELRAGFHIVGEAHDARSAYDVYRRAKPDVVVMDITLPGASGIEALRHIRQYDTEARVVVFTMHQGAGFALKAIEAGACGYVTKSSDPEFLLRAIEGTRSGRTVMSPDVLEAIATERMENAPDLLCMLSPRQTEILRMLASGWTQERVAETLCISVKTVRNNHYHIKSLLDVETDAQLVWFAVEADLIRIDILDPE